MPTNSRRRTRASHKTARFKIILLALVLIAALVQLPYLTEEGLVQDFFTNQIFNLGILFAIIVGFFTSITLERRQALDEYISLELNKIRRIYHLGMHLASAEPGCKKWFRDLTKAIRNYQRFFRTRSFTAYEDGNPLFREITYAVYRLPSLKLPIVNELYYSLLETTGQVTEAREHIRAKLLNRIGTFQWIVLMIVTVTLAIALVLSTPSHFLMRSMLVAVIMNLFLVLGLIYEYDIPSQQRMRSIAELYTKNLPEIDQR